MSHETSSIDFRVNFSRLAHTALYDHLKQIPIKTRLRTSRVILLANDFCAIRALGTPLPGMLEQLAAVRDYQLRTQDSHLTGDDADLEDIALRSEVSAHLYPELYDDLIKVPDQKKLRGARVLVLASNMLTLFQMSFLHGSGGNQIQLPTILSNQQGVNHSDDFSPQSATSLSKEVPAAPIVEVEGKLDEVQPERSSVRAVAPPSPVKANTGGIDVPLSNVGKDAFAGADDALASLFGGGAFSV